MEVGSLVECVFDYAKDYKLFIRRFNINCPEKDQLYIVREVILLGQEVGLLLEGLNNEHCINYAFWFTEPAFNIESFREVQTLTEAHELMKQLFSSATIKPK